MKRIISVLLVLVLVFACVSALAEEKTKIKFYGECIEYTSGPKMVDALIEEMGDVYDIERIQIDWTNLNKVIRTGIASGEPCDIYNIGRDSLNNFADMVVDLTPYLDADPEWRAQFSDEVIESCKIDGKVVCMPWETNFTTVLVNNEKLTELGIELPETAWTWDEFTAVCQKIQDAGYFPFANATDLARASWPYLNALLSLTVGTEDYDNIYAGTFDYAGEKSIKALEAVKGLYDAGYMYPGEGAVTVKNDEIKAAFYQGDVLMMAEIAAGAYATSADAPFEVLTMAWPTVGDTMAAKGGNNVLFIPKNSAHIEEAVEVLKVYTSKDIQQIHALDGYIPTNAKVEIENPFTKTLLNQLNSSKGFPFSAEILDYYNTSLVADLVLNGGVELVAANLAAIVA